MSHLPKLPALIATTRKFDFNQFYNELVDTNNFQKILDADLDLSIISDNIHNLLKVNYNKYSYVFIFKEDLYFKDILSKSNFSKSNLLVTI